MMDKKILGAISLIGRNLNGKYILETADGATGYTGVAIIPEKPDGKSPVQL